MKMNKTVLAAAAIVLPLSIGAGSALSYFTANDSAVGGYAIEVGLPEGNIDEEYSNWEKRITITNTGDTPMYVRARAFVVSPYTVTASYDATEDDKEYWTTIADSEWYYYYSPALKAGDTTAVLKLKIGGLPENPVESDEFDVVVVYEKTTAVEIVDGEVKPDWDFALVTEETEKLKTTDTLKGGNN